MIYLYHSNYYTIFDSPNQEKFCNYTIDQITPLKNGFKSVCYTLFVLNLLTFFILVWTGMILSTILEKFGATSKTIQQITIGFFIIIALIFNVSSYITGSFMYYLSRSKILWKTFLVILLINFVIMVFLKNFSMPLLGGFSLIALFILLIINSSQTEKDYYEKMRELLRSLKPFMNEKNIKQLKTIYSKSNSSSEEDIINFIKNDKNNDNDSFFTLFVIELAKKIAKKLDGYKYDKDTGKITSKNLIYENPENSNHRKKFNTIINIVYDCLIDNCSKTNNDIKLILNKFFDYKDNTQSLFFWKTLLITQLSEMSLNDVTKFNDCKHNLLDLLPKNDIGKISKYDFLDWLEYFNIIPKEYEMFVVPFYTTTIKSFFKSMTKLSDKQKINITDFFHDLFDILTKSEIFQHFNVLNIFFRTQLYLQEYYHQTREKQFMSNSTLVTTYRKKILHDYCSWSLEFLLLIVEFIEIEKITKNRKIKDILNDTNQFENHLTKKLGKNNIYKFFPNIDRIDDGKYSIQIQEESKD